MTSQGTEAMNGFHPLGSLPYTDGDCVMISLIQGEKPLYVNKGLWDDESRKELVKEYPST